MSTNYEAVIGLEIHAQLKTNSKLFSVASSGFSSFPNENISEVCLGMPGTLPVLNKKAVELAVKTGLALNCEIATESVFSRKQYFYPDLSKGYQITQDDRPICGPGHVDFILDNQLRRVRLERAHLEEDAGKSVHLGTYSLINYNRAGTPLLEIVSKPDMRSPAEAAAFARAVRQILLFAETSEANLEEGNFRCDCNVSLRPIGRETLGTRVELKNINSFRFIEKALTYEIQRQRACLESGQTVQQETRLYDSVKNKTLSMRSKENAADYRYFPDPDIPPLRLHPEDVDRWKKEMPEGPHSRRTRYVESLGVDPEIADILCSRKEIADYFEMGLSPSIKGQKWALWITGDLLGRCHEEKTEFSSCPISAKNLATLVLRVDDGTLSGKMAKIVLDKMWKEGKEPDFWIDQLGLKTISDSGELLKMIIELTKEHADKVQEYQRGKEKLFGFFVGQIMKKTKGQAHPEKLSQLLREHLKKGKI